MKATLQQKVTPKKFSGVLMEKKIGKFQEFVLAYHDYAKIFVRLSLADDRQLYQVGGHDNIDDVVEALAKCTDTVCSQDWPGKYIGVVLHDAEITHFYHPMNTESMYCIVPNWAAVQVLPSEVLEGEVEPIDREYTSTIMELADYCDKYPTHPVCQHTAEFPISCED